MELLVKQIRWEAEHVVSLVLIDPSGAELPRWEPGAHVELHLPSGCIRHYSLCGHPEDRRHYQVAVLREPNSRGGSRFLHEELRVGTHLEVRTPRNNFVFTPTPKVEFIAGGIGITPLLPMIRTAQEQHLDWRLWYGGRSRTAMAFLDQLGQTDTSRIHLFPADEYGLIDLHAALGEPELDTSIYCCGPESLLNAVEQKCADWPAGALHLERFAAPATSLVTAMESPVDLTQHSFEVVARASGVTTEVAPGISILDALEEAGVAAPASCREGICGTCETGVLEGDPVHLDLILTDEEKAENACMMICISRCSSARLILDI